MGLSLERRAALRKVTALVQRGLVDAGDGDEFLTLYAGALGARGIVVGQGFGFNASTELADVPPGWGEHHTRYRHQDPAAAFLASSPMGTPYVASPTFTPALLRTELHRGFVRAGLSDVMVQHARTPFRDDIIVVTYRRRGMRHFDADDATLAALLYPHVAGALATRSALLAIGGGDVRVDAPPTDGHAFVGFPCGTVRLSRLARAAWERELGPLSSVGWRKVERLVARAAGDFLRGQPLARSRLVLPAMRVELAWFPPAAGEQRRALAVFFRERRRAPKLDAPALELLSPTQCAVAGRAAQGMTNAAIGASLGISLETVRSHLRDAFRRLDITRRAELAGFLTAESDDEA